MPSPVRKTLAGLRPYTATDAANAVDLSDNTNLWGTPPLALAAIGNLQAAALSRYPTTPPTALNEALGRYAGVSPDMIVTGCGSDDLIDCAMRAFAEPGDMIAMAVPTFSMVPVFATINGLRVHMVPLSPTFDVDVDALLAPRPAIVYLCSPNNPTGTALPLSTIARVVREAPGVVLLDEAYGEFTAAPGFSLVKEHDHVVITRTLSKAFGLAGLRIGYAVLASALAQALATVRGPYKLNVAAEAAALAAVTGDVAWVRDRAAEAATNRDRLGVVLRSAGLAPLPSESNFVCVPCRAAADVAQRLLRRGFAVRVLTGLPRITDSLAASQGAALRITVGPWPLMERFAAAFQEECATCV
ncbi:MAG TPA: histidinol-phosphate transaminase [Gemmatimonadaceae bacterium]|nr:histidinol-phosphate transaminase [Gemmatimonadaceae bacterium]